MARDESHREDLLREATALVERVELVPGGDFAGSATAAPIVAGFRAGGALSLFFGEDPVYQFNAAGKLRRAYVDGRLYKAVGGRLVELERVRQLHRVELRRHELTTDEESNYLSRMIKRIHELQALLDSGDFQMVGQIPCNANVVDRVQEWLIHHRAPAIATRPNA